jgi:NAD(P)-dependent dehydrogenase (short-subunit alcohol dehydrogenase family)/acyl carrier protein
VVSAAVLAVVAEKTGYPAEMLNLDMGLDSDLGIDSIKRVEIMAALKTQLPGAPEIKPEHLGALQTLRQVVDFLAAAPAPATPVAPPSAPAATTAPVSAESPASTLQRQIVRPVALTPETKRPTVTLATNSVIYLTDDGSTLIGAIDARLTKRGFTVVKGLPGALIARAATDAPAGLVAIWPETGGGDDELKTLFRLIQASGPSLRARKGILLTVSRLDGRFGFGTLSANANPVSGGLAGLAKTARLEWPEAHCKALDLDSSQPLPSDTADWIVDEMFHAGPVEVGISGSARFSLQVESTPATDLRRTPFMDRNDVIVVTGGARGITATTVRHLAHLHGGCWVLLGRSKLAEQEPEWLASLRNETEIKKALAIRANGNGSPKKIEAAYRDAMAQREIRHCLRDIQNSGARAVYRTVDVRNARDVEAAMASVRNEFGPIRGLIHGAGVLADRRIEDKTPEQFNLVYGTKVEGLRNLLTALAGDDLKVLALFSSYTGRFGRVGQVDYAAANEVLNKMAQAESRRRKQCRVVSFNWGPWNGGMVSDGLRRLFESEGVGLIEPASGAEFFARELLVPLPGPIEVLALAEIRHAADVPPESVVSYNVALDREVSVKSLPCLESHVLNGRAVMPAALMIEWLAHGAVHANPGMLFHGLENFKVLKGLILEKESGAAVSVLTGTGRFNNGFFIVPARLVSHVGDRQVAHAQGEVVLVAIATPFAIIDKTRPRYSYTDGRLFHGPHFHGIETLESCTGRDASALVKSAPTPKHWVRHPLRPAWLSDPLALDSSFQLMILWSWQNRDAACLPCAIRRFRQFARAFPKEGTRVVIHVESAETALVTASLRFHDRHGALLAVAEGFECVIDNGLRDAFRLNRLSHEV